MQGIDWQDIDWQDWIDRVRSEEQGNIRSLEDIKHLIDAEFDPDSEMQGDCLPWSFTHDKFRLRPGECTVWAGINGHGKSAVLLQVALWLLPVSQIFLASFEMPMGKSAKRMMRQASGVDFPSPEFRSYFSDYSFGKLWLLDESGNLGLDRLEGLIGLAVYQYHAKHIIIDSLMKLGMDDDDYASQKKAVNMLCRLAKTYQIHIHLVAHMRKGPHGEEKQPDKFDVMGSSSITNLCDNLIIVHRNKRKERLRETQSPDYEPKEFDTTLRVAKQRHGEWEGRIGLYYHPASMQYTKRRDTAQPWPSPEEHRGMRFDTQHDTGSTHAAVQGGMPPALEGGADDMSTAF